MPNNSVKSATSEVVGATSEYAFKAIATAAGFPALALAAPFAKGLVLGVVENCFNDCYQMTLSVNEKKKLNQVSSVALQTFWELAEKDGVVAWQMNIDPAYIDYAYEVAEHATMEAIRQSEKKKVDILGHFYGKQFYKGACDWQDMHQMITMAGTLSFRQIVLIRLINERFGSMNPELFITNPSACIEINRMQDYGLWMTDMAMFKDDASARIQIKLLKPTDYTRMACDFLMLETISNEDVQRVIDSLAISEQGEPAEGISKEDFEASNYWTEYNEAEETFSLNSGKRKSIQDIAAAPEDVALMVKGQNMMTDAKQNAVGGYMMNAIDSIMHALGIFKQCKTEKIYQPAIDDALKELITYFEDCKKEGGLRILVGKREEYISIISDLNSEYTTECQVYLSKAEEKEPEYENEVAKMAIDRIIDENS